MATSDPAEGSAGFDVREFARTAQGSLRGAVDVEAFAAEPLPRDVVGTLRALAALEGATMAHLRNVLVTSTHKDARVTAFLVTWAYEKFWIADALQAVVDASTGTGGTSGADAATPVNGAADAPASAGRRLAASAGRGPVRRAFAGFTQGWAAVGAHMALGFVDDRMLRAAYARVVDVAASDALDRVVAEILHVKQRHAEFFDEEARRRLAASPRSARLARRELRRTSWPLGSAALEPGERRAFARFAFGGEAGDALADALARDIRALPGMDARTAASVRDALTTLAARPAA